MTTDNEPQCQQGRSCARVPEHCSPVSAPGGDSCLQTGMALEFTKLTDSLPSVGDLWPKHLSPAHRPKGRCPEEFGGSLLERQAEGGPWSRVRNCFAPTQDPGPRRSFSLAGSGEGPEVGVSWWFPDVHGGRQVLGREPCALRKATVVTGSGEDTLTRKKGHDCHIFILGSYFPLQICKLALRLLQLSVFYLHSSFAISSLKFWV